MSRLEFIAKPGKLIDYLRDGLFNLDDDIQVLILYGSVVHGDFLVNSDVDLFAIVESKQAKRNLELRLDELLLDQGIPYDLVCLSPNEFKKQQSSSLIREVLDEGEKLWEKKRTD